MDRRVKLDMDTTPQTPAPRLSNDRRLDALLHATVVVAAVAFMGLYVYVALSTLWYPYQLEWMEGGTMDVVQRITDGQPVYVRPTIDYVPFIYPPLYFYVSATMARWTGVEFQCARLVSFGATLMTAGLLALLARRETQRWSYGVIAAGLFLATFDVTGRWFNLARVDSLYLCLLLLGFACFRVHTRMLCGVLAGVIWAAAFFTKQNALIVVLPIVLFGAIRRRRHSLLCLAALGLCITAAVVHFHRSSDGWFWMFVFKLPGQHEMAKGMLIRFWTVDVFYHVPLLVMLSAIALRLRHAPERQFDRRSLMVFAASLVLSSWIGRLHSGGYTNVVIPAYVGLGLLATLGYWAIRERGVPISAVGASGPAAAGPRARRWSGALAALALLAQFGLFAYDPRHAIPTAADRQAGDEMLKRLARFEGDVLMTEHSFIQKRCGKSSCALGMAAYDVRRSTEQPLIDLLNDSIHRAMLEGRFAAVVLPSEVAQPYALEAGEPLFDSPDGYYPVTGARYRPQRIHRVQPQYAPHQPARTP